MKIISGGQTGVDRAALDVAMGLGLAAGGWCPAGRRSEDGVIPDHYPLVETRSSEFHVRTQRNVETSSATLVFTRGAPTGGTRYTVEVAQSMRRPCLVIDVSRRGGDHVSTVADWLRLVGPRVLNVAGPRESGAPGIGAETTRILTEALVRAGAIRGAHNLYSNLAEQPAETKRYNVSSMA
ncbi:MAG: putative molybdenum carrier protein [Myxococcota bacterium]